MNSVILHISDLHVSLDKRIGGGINNHDSYLSTNPDEEKSNHYIDKFIASVLNSHANQKIYLLITGDITNTGEKKEFDFVKKFIKRIIKGLEVNKANILLIPGDHDINRRDLTNLLADYENSSEDEINNAKFKNFKDFYEELLDKTFDPNKIIFDTLTVEDSIVLLGLNSCRKIDLENLLGYIEIEKFDNEYQSHNFLEKKIVACLHHNFTSSYENKNDGQWVSENRKIFISKLLSYDINYVFTGNEHTNSCKTLLMGELTTSDSGTFSSLKYDTTYKVYPVVISEDIVLQNKIYSLQKTNGNDSAYEWDIRTNKTFSQPEEFVLFRKHPPTIEEDIDESLPSIEQSGSMADKVPEKVSDSVIANIYYNSKFTDILYDKVKELKIFHTGHFHWSESSRAHNWIDVSKLIEDKANLNFLKDAIIDVLESKIGAMNIDLIIGLGYEGNILATKSTVKYNKPYSFLPYSYRHHEHHKFETELNFDNSSRNYKNVLIVTDVVNDGRTIRKLIKKRQEQFFSNVEKVYVISLFYTGELTINYNILNFDFLKSIPNYNLDGDEDVNNIEYYAVKSLKVEKCPYGKNFREECFIYRDELSCVNLFYDEKKYLSQV